MDQNDKLTNATMAVDAAWQQWKQLRDAKSEAAYDQAFDTWKALGANRAIGRPRSGDQVLNSSERAQAARSKQQHSAEKWDRVAPLIQRLRKAVDMKDNSAITRITGALVKETEMAVKDLKVIHAQPDSDFVVLNGWHDRQMILAFIPTMHLEDHLRRRRLTGKEANLLVDRNVDTFSRIISAKYERGEYRPYSRAGSTLPRIDVTLEDIETSGERISDTVLNISAGWVSPNGGWSPA